MKYKITVSEELKTVAPNFVGAAISAQVVNSKYSETLWSVIQEFEEYLKANQTVQEIKDIPTIHATREVYKKCRKDPNRYRPAGEALRRRIIRGLSLYQIDTLVDLVNLVSLYTGYSMGGFDADQIVGDKLVLGIGESEEKFEGIGKGLLNIEGLPVYRDEVGGIGTPTSDEERTKIVNNTSNLLILINGYSGEEGLAEAVEYTINLLEKHAEAKDIQFKYYR